MTDRPRRFGLSKSKITMFEQCPERLWLSVHRPDLAEQDEGAEARFATGHEVGAIACVLLPDGVMVDAGPDPAAALATTQALLDGGLDRPIFEATPQHDGVLVRIDVLEPDGSGGWRMAEVNSSTKAKDHHVGDLATQVWVARNAGVPISSASIRHSDSSFVLERGGSALRCAVPVRVRRLLPLGAPARADWPVTVPPHGGAERWIEQGVVDLPPVTRADWYHRDQRGSWSIKAVLPMIAAEMDYAALEVKDGGSAQDACAEAIAADCTVERRLALDAALRAYCGRDTEAMIVLAQRPCDGAMA